MARQQRGLRRYNTRTTRLLGDKFERRYIGTADSALTAALAASDAGRRLLRLLRRRHETVWYIRQVDRVQAIEQRVSEASRLASAVAGFMLEAAGFRQHRRGAWRGTRMGQVIKLNKVFRETLPKSIPERIDESWMLALGERAHDDEEALDVVRWLQDKLPDGSILFFAGDPAPLTEALLVHQLAKAGPDQQLALR
jgi:hypothetical protein